MERLTEKSKYGYRAKDGDYKFPTQKLGKLEDIEEELGIPLEALFKALKDGIWGRDINRKMRVNVYFDINDETWYIYNIVNLFFVHSLKDYGVTWALTKEKLDG